MEGTIETLGNQSVFERELLLGLGQEGDRGRGRVR